MKLRTKPIKIKPKSGDIKVTRKYAWWPKQVQDKVIWLEDYELVEVMSMRPRIIFACHVPLVAPWGWDFVEERLIKKNTIPDFKHTPPPPGPK